MHLKWIVIGCAAMLAVAGCDQNKSSSSSSSGASSSSGSNGGGSSEIGPDEAAALTDPTFTSPIVLHMNSDDANAANGYAALGSGPVDYWGVLNKVAGCNTYDRSSPWNGGVTGFNIDTVTVGNWLQNSGWQRVTAYTISYTHGPGGGENGFGTLTATCRVITDKVAQYVPPSTDIHNSVDVPIAKRVCSRWTYANAYDTDLPGQGQLKVFAGTFVYRVVPLVPGVTSSGEAHGSVKMFLNPDNGQWTFAGHSYDDNLYVGLVAADANASTPTPPDSGACPGP